MFCKQLKTSGLPESGEFHLEFPGAAESQSELNQVSHTMQSCALVLWTRAAEKEAGPNAVTCLLG